MLGELGKSVGVINFGKAVRSNQNDGWGHKHCILESTATKGGSWLICRNIKKGYVFTCGFTGRSLNVTEHKRSYLKSTGWVGCYV